MRFPSRGFPKRGRPTFYARRFWTGIVAGFLAVGLLLGADFGVWRSQAADRSEVGDRSDPGVVIIACDREFPPYTFVDSSGNPAGFLVDVWTLWSAKISTEISFRISDWNGMLTGLKSGDVHVIPGLFRNPKQESWMAFSMPFYDSGSSLFFPVPGPVVRGMKDLMGKRVGAIRGGDAAAFLGKNGAGIEVVLFDDPTTMVQAAPAGGLQALADETLGMSAVLEKLGVLDRFDSVQPPLYRKSFHAAVLKENTELLKLVDQGLSRISDLEWAELEARWVPDPDVRRFHP